MLESVELMHWSMSTLMTFFPVVNCTDFNEEHALTMLVFTKLASLVSRATYS